MDPRVARTTARLHAALLDLAREQGLDAVTIGQITARAGVNRSTFYEHFQDKDSLLADALEAAVDDVTMGLRVSPESTGAPAELDAYLRHVSDYVDVYRFVLSEQGSAVATARLRARLDSIIAAQISLAGPTQYGDVPVDVVAAGLAGAAIGVVTAWIGRDPLPPVQVASAWMWTVLTGGADEVREPSP